MAEEKPTRTGLQLGAHAVQVSNVLAALISECERLIEEGGRSAGLAESLYGPALQAHELLKQRCIDLGLARDVKEQDGKEETPE